MDNEMQKYCVLYTRVSSEKQIDGYSLDSQKDLCEQKAKQLGYIVAKVFREEGVSATTTVRPQLQEMISYCKARENNIDAVVVYSLSRFARNTADHLAIRHLLSKAGVSLISVSEPTGDTPEGNLIETILASFAEYENKSRARNVANSLKKRFLEGHITSKPPLGYLMQKVNGKSIAVKDSDCFEVLKFIWYRVVPEQLSLQDVAHELNKLGVKSKHSRLWKKFSVQYASGIFSNKFYMGILVSKKYGEAKGLHDPMIDETTFYQVRDMLTGRKPKSKARYHLRDDFPLRGILNCPMCERKLSSGWTRGSTKRYPYYICTTRGVHKVVSYPRDKIEKKFEALLQSIQPTEKFMEFFTEILKEKYNARFKQIDLVHDQVIRDIELLEETKKKLREKNLKGIYTDEEYLEMKDEINTQITIKQAILNEKKMENIDIDTVLEFMEFYLTNLDKIFLKASPEGRLKIGSSMFPNGIVYENGSFRTPQLGRAYSLTRDFSTTPFVSGEPHWNRTSNLLLKRELLCQLS